MGIQEEENSKQQSKDCLCRRELLGPNSIGYFQLDRPLVLWGVWSIHARLLYSAIQQPGSFGGSWTLFCSPPCFWTLLFYEQYVDYQSNLKIDLCKWIIVYIHTYITLEKFLLIIWSSSSRKKINSKSLTDNIKQ